jgi:hypothetical protein
MQFAQFGRLLRVCRHPSRLPRGHGRVPVSQCPPRRPTRRRQAARSTDRSCRAARSGGSYPAAPGSSSVRTTTPASPPERPACRCRCRASDRRCRGGQRRRTTRLRRPLTGRDGTPIPLLLHNSDGGYGYDATDLATYGHKSARDAAHLEERRATFTDYGVMDRAAASWALDNVLTHQRGLPYHRCSHESLHVGRDMINYRRGRQANIRICRWWVARRVRSL